MDAHRRQSSPLPRSGLWAPLLVAAAVTLPFLSYFFGHSTSYVPLYEDEAQWSIYARYINDAYGRGSFPLWAHDLYSGYPLVAWSHAAIFNPLSLIFRLWDFSRGVWINQWVHSLIFSLGLYAFGLRARASRPAAAAAAVAGGLIFVLLALMNAMPVLRTGAWIPLWSLSLAGLAAERRIRWLRWHLLATLMMYLGGDAEIITLGYEFAAVALGAATVAALVRGGLRPALGPALLLGAALAAGLLLSQVQALPTFELTRFSVRRAGLAYEARQTFALSPLALPLLVALGPALVAAAAGLMHFRRTPLFWAAVVSLAYSLAGAFNLFGVDRLLDFLPVVGGLVNQYRILLFCFPCVMALAAVGLDAIGRSTAGPRWMAAAGGGMILTQLMLLALALATRGRDFFLFYQLDRARAVIYAGFAPCVALGLLLAAAPWWAVKRPQWARRILLAAMVLLSLPVPAAMPRKPSWRDDHLTFYHDFVRSHPGRYRTQSVYRLSDFPDLTVPAQTGGADGTMAADAWITVTIDRYARLLDAFLPDTVTEKDGRISGYAAHRVLKEGVVNQSALRLYNLLGIKYLLSDRVNLKFGSDYFLAYPDSPLVGYSGRRAPGFSEDKLNLTFFVGRQDGDLFIRPGDRLRLEVGERPDPNSGFGPIYFPNGRWLVVTARVGGSTHLIMARRVDNEIAALDSALPAPEPGSVESLSFASPNKSFLCLGRPRVVHQTKYFKLVDLEGSSSLPDMPLAPFEVFENPGALPLVFIAPQTVSAAREDAAALMQAPGWDPARTAVAEGLPDRPYRALRQDETATIEDMDWRGVSISARAAVPRTLVLTDVYYPGWQAWVNDQPARIYPVDLAFKGIELPPGRSEVRLEFRPVSFRLGLWVTLGSLISALAALKWHGHPARDSEHGLKSNAR